MGNKSILLLKNIPPSVVSAKYDINTKNSPARAERITNLFFNAELGVIYTYLERGELLDKLITVGLTPMSIQGVDFDKQYKLSFENKRVVLESPVLYIYNIGVEPANNYEYSDKVLRSLVQAQVNRGGQVILSSEFVDTTTFRNRYKLTYELVEMQVQYNKVT